MSTATGGFIGEALSKQHDRATFDGGHTDLNAYLRDQSETVAVFADVP